MPFAPEVAVAVLPAESVTVTVAPVSAVPIATVPVMEVAVVVVGELPVPLDEEVLALLLPPPPHAARTALMDVHSASFAIPVFDLALTIELPAVVGLDHVERVVELERVLATESGAIDLGEKIASRVAWKVRAGPVELGAERARAVAGSQFLIQRLLFLVVVFPRCIVVCASTVALILVALEDLYLLLDQILTFSDLLCPIFQLVLLVAVRFERQAVLHLDLVVAIVVALSAVDSIEVGHLDVLAIAQLHLNGVLCIRFARATATATACGKQNG